MSNQVNSDDRITYLRTKNPMTFDGILKPIYQGKFIRIMSKPCYYIVEELIPKDTYGCKDPMPITYALSKAGDYIGNSKTAYRLVNKFGISVFEKRTNSSSVCSLGYNLHKKLWYGWSHRAIHGFKNKRDAERFAESVS